MAREKEKLRSDLDKAEKLKFLMASEVDDHHAAIERRNEYNLRYDIPVHPSPSLWHHCHSVAGAQRWRLAALHLQITTELHSQHHWLTAPSYELFLPPMPL